MTSETLPPHVVVCAIHPLYDTRIRNHLATLVAGGYRVTYLNWSLAPKPEDQAQYGDVTLIHCSASPVFGKNVFRWAWMLGWFFWHTLRARANLVHIHDVLILPLVWPLRLTGHCRIVFDVHEHYLQAAGLMGRFARLAYSCFLPFAQGLVGVSPSTLPRTARPSVVVPNYQRRADFLSQPGEMSSGDGLINVVYFGSLSSEDRDVPLLLEVAEAVLGQSAEVRFKYGGRLVGSDAAENSRRLTALAQRFSNRFFWLGEMARAQVLRESAAAQVGLLFLKPQTFNLTGSSPNKIFEYAAIGAAILATDGFEIAAEVKEQGAGVLFPPGVTAEKVVEAILALVQNREKLAQMQAASRRLGDKYTWEAVAPRYLELYRQLGLEAPTPKTT